MGCCGGSGRVGSSGGGGGHPGGGTPGGGGRRYANAWFMYQGSQRGLTVLGPATGRRYLFSGPGAVVAVEPADRRHLARVPALRQVAHP